MSGQLPLVADGVSRAYGDKRVVNKASLTLRPGEITALLGMSGAGKSTLLRLMAGLESVNEGTIRLGDKVLSSTSEHVPAEDRHIGLIFQDFALFPHLNAIDNVSFGLSRMAKNERRRIALDWLDRLGLSHRANAFPHQLSGGEQQRVSIARALAAKPVAILMDEPFSGLDVTLKSDVRRIALDAVSAAGIPALLVSHDASEAMRDADRIAVMKDGAILQEGTPEDLYLHPNSLAVARALGPLQSIRREQMPESWRAQLPEAESYCLRPEAIRMVADGPAAFQVKASKRASTLVELDLIGEAGDTFKAVSMGPHRPLAGDTVHAALSPEFAFILPSDAG
ncbi:ABC transporter ATP-binding protein [Henriciella sp. AS95]|uniref:ABC transporter ATP-binding protein n=1 Tax=Henriciella sp. AS95 TaxID=3135782 RepID=UPI00316DA24E